MQRRLARDLGLDDQSRAHHVGRIGAPGDFGNADRLLDRAAADKGALADVTPDAAVLLQHGQRLAQIAARHAKAFAKLALGRQPRFAGQIHLRQVGLELHQRGVAAVSDNVR